MALVVTPTTVDRQYHHSRVRLQVAPSIIVRNSRFGSTALPVLVQIPATIEILTLCLLQTALRALLVYASVGER